MNSYHALCDFHVPLALMFTYCRYKSTANNQSTLQILQYTVINSIVDSANYTRDVILHKGINCFSFVSR